MQPWDTFIRNSTDQFGNVLPPANLAGGPASGTGLTASQPTMQQRQLSARRELDNKFRYGKEVSDLELAKARNIGAIAT